MKTALSATALAVVLGLGAAPALFAQTPPAGPRPPEGDGGHAKVLAIRQLTASTPAKLTVTSPSFQNGGDIPFENTQYRGNIFPGLSWTAGPPGAKSYMVVTQGALGGGDDLSHGTSIHFVMYDIPAGVTKIDRGAKAPPAGAAMGSTVHGMKDFYAGPHTHNFVKHGYHYQVLALDTVLPVDPKATLASLEKAAEGHVLATGEVVGLVAMDPDSPEAAEFRKKQAAGQAGPKPAG